MKTHTIKTDNAELLLVELPQGWIFNTYKDQIGVCNEINKPMTQIKGSYTLLGKPDEVKEEDAKNVVHEVEGYNPVLKEFHKAYRLYSGRIIRATHTAKESLLSLLETEIYWDNPLGTRKNVDKIASFKSEIAGKHLITLWHEADQKTFDRNRSIIFKKNK